MQPRGICVDCHKETPSTNSDGTLMTSYGWRLSRRTGIDGETISEWRCPDCWAVFKGRKKPSLFGSNTSFPPPLLPRTKPDGRE